MSWTPHYDDPRLAEVQQQATGRWHSILPALGIPDSFLKNRKGPCPICGGTDRFTFDNREGQGTWFCQSCGAGDGIRLVTLALRKGWSEAAEDIALHVTGPAVRSKTERSDEQKRYVLRAVWAEARAITLSDPVGTYLYRRCGITVFPPALRYHPALAYQHMDGSKTRHPTMLAQVRNKDGRPVNIHRTYLDDLGHKAKVPEPKRVMPGQLPPGCSIWLTHPSSELGISEGIETAFSANALHGVCTWAAISAKGLERWEPPEHCEIVHVFGDADLNYVGQAAAFALGARLVRAKLSVQVHIPAVVPNDFNDEHQARLDISR